MKAKRKGTAKHKYLVEANVVDTIDDATGLTVEAKTVTVFRKFETLAGLVSFAARPNVKVLSTWQNA